MKGQDRFISVFWNLFLLGKTLLSFFFFFSWIVFCSRITYVPAEHLEEFKISLGQQSGGIMALDVFSSYSGR